MPKGKMSPDPRHPPAPAVRQPKTSTKLYEAIARDTVFDFGCLANVLGRVHARKSVAYEGGTTLRFRLGPAGIARLQNMLKEHRAQGCGQCLAVTLREIGE